MGMHVWITDGAKVQQFICTQIIPDPADVADRELSRLLEGFKLFNSGVIPGIYVTEVIHPSSPRNHDPTFDLPKIKDECGLIDKGTVEVFCRQVVEQDTNILGGRFVLAIKNGDKHASIQGKVRRTRAYGHGKVNVGTQCLYNLTTLSTHSRDYCRS